VGLGPGAVEGVVISVDFWRDRSVLVTGHTGFKGGWLCLWLKSLGARVTGFALPPPTDPSLFEVARVADGMTSIIGDVRDYTAVRAAFETARPEVVIHMAAQPLVRLSYEQPVETYAANVMGTVHVLEATRSVGGVRSFVAVTSDKCYENREWSWGYRENEAMGGYDPYSSSKGCSELVVSAYRRSFFNPADHTRHGTGVATARAGNVIGGGDWAKDRLMTDLIAAITGGRPAIIRNPGALRPWQHVLEPLRGYMMLAERLWTGAPEFADGWNFGPEDDSVRPVSWIADHLTKLWGEGASWELDGAAHPHEARYLKLDCSKAKAVIGWRPVWDLERSLDQILAWQRALHADRDMGALCRQQISEYLDDVRFAEADRGASRG